MTSGPPPLAGALDGLARRLVHREEIVAVDLDRRQAETAGPSGDVAGRRPRSDSRCPRRTGCSRTRRPPAAAAPPPCSAPRRWCPGWTRRRRRSTPRPCRCPSVFAVSAAPITSGGPPPTMPLAPSIPWSRSAICIEPPLPPHSPPACRTARTSCRRRRSPWRSSGRGRDGSRRCSPSGPRCMAHADRRRLLAGVEVDKARDAAFRELLLHPLLEAADRDHVAIGADQLLAA